MKHLILLCLVSSVLVLPDVALAQTAAQAAVESVRDYQTVRRVGLALAALAFLMGVTRAATSDMPHEQGRAQDLTIRAAIIFLIMAGDRFLAQGLAAWFNIPIDALPLFWQ